MEEKIKIDKLDNEVVYEFLKKEIFRWHLLFKMNDMDVMDALRLFAILMANLICPKQDKKAFDASMKVFNSLFECACKAGWAYDKQQKEKEDDKVN